MGTADYGQPTDPLSTPSLSQWAQAVHLDTQATDSEQAAQDARLDVLEAERSLGDLDDVNVADLPPADGDRLAWSDALGQWQPQPPPVNVLGDLTDVILTHPRPTDHLIFDGTVWRNRPAGVLGEAVWHVSADTALPDRLPDLTGQGRDALFGADAAAPRVLPWDGETYLAAREDADTNNRVELLGGPYTLPLGTRITADFEYVGGDQPVSLLDQHSGNGRLQLRVRNVGVDLGTYNGATWAYIAGPALGPGRHTIDVTESADGTGVDSFLIDGIEYGPQAWPDARVRVPDAGSVIHYSFARLYGLTVTLGGGGDPDWVLDPSNASDDYTSIPNTGSAGGTWSIIRAASGFKTAVVDRPMLLFGGGQAAAAMIPGGIGDGTLLFAVRTWSDTASSRYWVGAAAASVGGVYAYQNSVRVVSLCYVGADASTRADIPSIGAYGQHVIGARLAVPSAFDGLLDGAVVGTSPTVAEGARLLHDRISIGLAGLPGAFEFLAAAIFDRSLTDTEIEDVSAALGRPPTAARHAPLVEASIPAALPPAQPGSIAVLEDNTIAVRTRTGGWVQLAASPLPGGSP